MSLDVPLSARRLRELDDAERLILWALRHRVAEGDPASAHLVNAFDVVCGPAAGPRARGALERLVDGLETFARRPLALLDWGNDALTTDEAALLAVCAELQAGRPPGSTRWSCPQGPRRSVRPGACSSATSLRRGFTCHRRNRRHHRENGMSPTTRSLCTSAAPFAVTGSAGSDRREAVVA